MAPRHPLFLVLLVAAAAHCGRAQQAPLPQLDISGFTWAENQAFDVSGNLFVSDSQQGKIWKISLFEQKDGSQQYERVLHTSDPDFNRVNGLFYHESEDILYAAVQFKDVGWATLAVDPDKTDSWKIVAYMDGGNGLTYDERNRLLYTTSEGNFVPKAGIVAAIDPYSNSSKNIVTGLGSADGAQMLNDYLYISLVLDAAILAYDVSSPYEPQLVCQFVAPSNVRSIDDFTFGQGGRLIYGADYRNNSVVIFDNLCYSYTAAPPGQRARSAQEVVVANDDDEPATLLMTGLLSPTSVYFAPTDSQTFNTTCVFVSEGGGLSTVQKNRRVLQSPYALV